MDMRGRHNVGTEINQQIIVDQCSGPFPKTRPTQRACLGAVSALAKSLWEGIRSAGSKESNDHRGGMFPELWDGDVSFASKAALMSSPVEGIARLADLAHLDSEIQESQRPRLPPCGTEKSS